MISRKKKKNKVAYNENIFSILQNDLRLPLKSIKSIFDGFIDDIFDNELLFFKWEIDIVKTRKYLEENDYSICYVQEKYRTEYFQEELFTKIDLFLSEIELLEYVYLLKTEKKYYLFFVVKSLLGYNKTLLTKYISMLNNANFLSHLSYSTIKYVDSRKRAKEYFYFLISQYKDYLMFTKNSYNFRFFYVKQAIGNSYTNYIGSTYYSLFDSDLGLGYSNSIYIDSDIYFMNSIGHIVFNKFKSLRNKEIYDKPSNSEFLELIEHDVFTLKNDLKLISTKNVCEQSIINLWVIYMRLNGFYIKDGHIYERFNSDKESRFVSTLDYLRINIDVIIYYLKRKYGQQLLSYPIELKVMPYLESAYNRVLSSPYYYLPDDSDLENIHKIYKKDTTLKKNISDSFINEDKLKRDYYKICALDEELFFKLFYADKA
jgi:hypothetical protein